MSQALVYDPKGKKQRFLAGMEKVLGIKRGTVSYMVLAPGDEKEGLFNEEHGSWAAPWEPDRIRTESYGELFNDAVSLGAEWVMQAFVCRAEKDFSPLTQRLGERTMDGKNGKSIPKG